MITRLVKAIVVCGVANTGKTTAIRNVARQMNIDVAPPSADFLFAGIGTPAGLRINLGIASQGDTLRNIVYAFDFFENTPVDLSVLVMACRSYGQTKQEVQRQLIARSVEPFFINSVKVSSGLAKQANQTIGDQIIRRILA